MAWEVKISDNATTQDTIDLIIKTVNQYKDSDFVKVLVNKLNPNGSKQDFIKRLFADVCMNIEYKRDDIGHEKVYTPERTYIERAGDCKKMATIIASVLKSVGIEPLLKVISYNGTTWEHIYVICKLNDKWIVLDPVNNCQYNKELQHKKAEIFNLRGNKMELSMMGNKEGGRSLDLVPDLSVLNGSIDDICGHIPTANNNKIHPQPTQEYLDHIAAGHHKIISEDEMDAAINHFLTNHKKYFPNHPMHQAHLHGMGSFWSNPFKSIKNSVTKIEHSVAKAALSAQHFIQKNVKSAGKDVGKAWHAVTKVIKQVGLSPVRNAFLGLVRLGKVAHKELGVDYSQHLANSWNKNPQELKDFWSSWGGDPDRLRDAIIHGSTGIQIKGEDEGMGMVPAALAAAAAPILTVAYKFLKDTGIVPSGSTADVAMAAATGGAIEASANSAQKNGGITPAEQSVNHALNQAANAINTTNSHGSFFDKQSPVNIIWKSIFFFAISPNSLMQFLCSVMFIYGILLLIKSKSHEIHV